MINQHASRNSSVLLAWMLALPLASPLQAQRPLVVVQFQIDAPDFRRNLYRKTAQIEQILTTTLLDLGADRFAFLSWQPLHEFKHDVQFAALLHISLAAEKEKAFGSTIWLRFSAEAGRTGVAYRCASGGYAPISFDPDEVKRLDRQIFSKVDLQPTGDPAATMKAILGQLDDDFRNTLASVFLSKIPFCREVVPHVEDLVKIGVGLKDMAIADDSKMRLSLCHRYQGTGRAGKSLELVSAIDKGKYPPNDPDPEKIQAQILCLSDKTAPCPGILGELRNSWSTELFMIDFKRQPSGTAATRATNSSKR